MKRRTLALILGLILAFGLTACGGSEEPAPAETDETTETETEEPAAAEKTEYKIGETWTVDGLWEMTVTGVTETADRNEYDEREPAAVYIVDYTYTNIGFEDDSGLWDGLYLSADSSIIDNAGTMGYSYPGNTSYYPQETPVGATCTAQACIGVDNAGSFKLNVSQYDNDGNNHKATFLVEVN